MCNRPASMMTWIWWNFWWSKERISIVEITKDGHPYTLRHLVDSYLLPSELKFLHNYKKGDIFSIYYKNIQDSDHVYRIYCNK